MGGAGAVEEWRAVGDGWPYEVSDLGRVRRAERLRYLNSRPDGVLRPSPARGGYLRVTLSDVAQTGRTKTFMVHHLVCATFHGPRPGVLEAAHGNGVPTDNRADNLRWATRAQNEADKRRHGRSMFGVAHPLAKLTDRDVLAIRAMLATGRFRHADLAPLFVVSKATIGKVDRGDGWAHVP